MLRLVECKDSAKSIWTSGQRFLAFRSLWATVDDTAIGSWERCLRVSGVGVGRGLDGWVDGAWIPNCRAVCCRDEGRLDGIVVLE